MIHLWLVLWILLPLWPNLAPAASEASVHRAGYFQAGSWGGEVGVSGRTPVELLRTLETGGAERSSDASARGSLAGRGSAHLAAALHLAERGVRPGGGSASPHAERLPYDANAPPHPRRA